MHHGQPDTPISFGVPAEERSLDRRKTFAVAASNQNCHTGFVVHYHLKLRKPQTLPENDQLN